MNKITTIAVLFVIQLFWTSVIYAQVLHPTESKKIIEFSHNSPTTTQYAENIKFYDKIPFDGISVKLSPEVGGGNIFMINDWEQVKKEAKDKELNKILSIKKNRTLKHNFLVMYGASQMDWFSPKDWELAKENIHFGAKLAKEGGFAGILWDPEPYKPGKNPWKYDEQPHADKYSYEEYYKVVMEKGREFVSIIQQEFPGAVIFSLRELSDFQDGSPFSQFLLPVSNSARAMDILNHSWWGLHLAFTVGNVQALDPTTKFIDGNEEAYYYTSALEYFKFRDVIYNEALVLIPAELRTKFKGHYSIGHAVASDYIQGHWFGLLNGFSNEQDGLGKVLSDDERAKWFEHNMYYALLTSDEYMWIYTEKPNWWTGEGLPKSFYDAVESAKQKVHDAKPLGFSIEKMVQEGKEKAKGLPVK
jgi:hypothetical protein